MAQNKKANPKASFFDEYELVGETGFESACRTNNPPR